MASPAAAASRTARSAGQRVPGSGGRMEASTACCTRPSFSALVMRASHSSRRAVGALVERLLERLGHGAALFVEVDRARGGDDGPQLAQPVVLARRLGHRGTVLPVGQAHRRQQLVGHGQERVGGDRRLARGLVRRCSASRWPGGRPAGRRAGAARPPGSARAAARPAWRCGARSTSVRPGARPAPGGRRPRRDAGHRVDEARSATAAAAPVDHRRARSRPSLARRDRGGHRRAGPGAHRRRRGHVAACPSRGPGSPTRPVHASACP